MIKNFKYTLNLPKTNFSMKGNLIYKENEILKYWKNINIYKLIIDKNKKKKIFFLHDGPPYANGKIHIGHILNKILKDIIVKYKNLNNYNSPLVLGWDCHGLPIELKVKEKLKINENNYKEIFIKKCRNYADKQIKIQEKDIIKLGIFYDLNKIYKTMDSKTEFNILKIFNKLLKLNYLKIYKIPIYWCKKCKSTLSDFETDKLNIVLESLYINFELEKNSYKLILNKINNNNIFIKNIFIVSWTTTIWTILDTQALSIKQIIEYVIVENNYNYYILSKYFYENLKEKNKYKLIYNISGYELLKFNLKFIHPINNTIISLIENNKIENKVGTSIVNIAPGHNIIDYKIGKKNNLKIINNFKKDCYYYNNIFEKKISIKNLILKTKKILYKNNNIFLSENKKVNYLHCNRHKYPLISILLNQLFMDLNHNNLKNLCIENAKKIFWTPKWGKEKIISMIKNRDNWCISRQRKWGIPIKIFVNKNNNIIHPKNYIFINKISNLIKKNGIEYFYKIKKNFFLKKKELSVYKEYNWTLDIWFESGTTLLSTNIFKKKINADLLLEGNDQYRGWFISTLLIYTAIKNDLPYKNVLTHGFVLDKFSNKMSKSLNNVINLDNLLKYYSCDIVRLWISFSDYKKDIKISEENFDRIIDIYRKIRNTIRFLISNLYDFDFKNDIIKNNKLLEIDKWIINKLYKYYININNYYNEYKFYKIIKKISYFCYYYLGAIYFEIIKDRLYIMHKNSISRKSCQTTISIILFTIIKIISPILPFTSEEIYQNLKFNNKEKSVFLHKFELIKKIKYKKYINKNIWNILFLIKNKINFIIEKEIKNKNINSKLEIQINLYLDKTIFNNLFFIKKEIKYFFIISNVNIYNINKFYILKKKKNFFEIKKNNIYIIYKKIKNIYKKCNRCWFYYKKKDFNFIYNICIFCLNIIEGLNYKDRKYI